MTKKCVTSDHSAGCVWSNSPTEEDDDDDEKNWYQLQTNMIVATKISLTFTSLAFSKFVIISKYLTTISMQTWGDPREM